MSVNWENTVVDVLGNIIKAGGEVVPKEQFEKRLLICNGCPHKGKVTPLPLLKVDGCTLCGCPFRTKLRTKTHIKKLKRIQTKCPHPDGNKWAEIDKEFNLN